MFLSRTHRAVCSSLELVQTQPLTTLPNITIALVLSRMSEMTDGLFFWTGPPQKTSVVCAALEGRAGVHGPAAARRLNDYPTKRSLQIQCSNTEIEFFTEIEIEQS